MAHKRLKEIDEQERPVKRWPFLSDNCINVIACMLLTCGLCIIGIVVYLSVRQTTVQHNVEHRDIDSESANSLIDAYKMNITIIENDTETDQMRDLISVHTIEIPKMADIFFGCREFSCGVTCNNNNIGNLYADVARAMLRSHCERITELTLFNQTLKSLENKWLNLNRTVHKISLFKGEVKSIRSGAFNAPMFASIYQMVWYNVELTRVDSGALLGLYGLQLLQIDAKLAKLNTAFLQPVQRTLRDLRFHAGITFRMNSSIFRNFYFEKLEYLDLSRNRFEGALNRRIFQSMPNLKYLNLKHAHITAIEKDAFVDLGGKLLTLNLAYNLLKTLSGDVLLPLLGSVNKTFLELEPNQWHCDCELSELMSIYATHRASFLSSLYCKTPTDLFGDTIDSLNTTHWGCAPRPTTDITGRDDSNSATPSTTSTPLDCFTNSTNIKPFDSEELASNAGAVIQLECTKPVTVRDATISSSRTQNDLKSTPYINTVFFVFEPPKYDLVLTLYPNHSVQGMIAAYDPNDHFNVIWFTEDFENEELDYNCLTYTSPYIMTDTLKENTTYTFCMIPNNEDTISPLNCQPLHVPLVRIGDNLQGESERDLEGEKEFAIGILCLIFSISALFGGIIAYFSIKAYPDLLEGSKNVLVVKKSDRCYISTIGDNEIIEKKPFDCSFKKEKENTCEQRKQSDKDISCCASKQLDRLSSVKSSSTLFEEAFSNVTFLEDEYEMPKNFVEQLNSEKRKATNNYCVSPGSPPPLPKRNSN